MSKTLKERLKAAKEDLKKISRVIGRHPGALPDGVEKYFQDIVLKRNDIDHWISMLGIRADSLKLLDGLDGKVDKKDDKVSLGRELKLEYQNIRFIGFQAYITTNWALSDSITNFVGMIMCSPKEGLNPIKPTNFKSFLSKDERNNHVAAVLSKSIRKTFGWPIGLSYAIRNHFVHNGAQVNGLNFFNGPSAASGFQISEEVCKIIEETAHERFNVDSTCVKKDSISLESYKSDFRELLKVCQREMDEALGILIGTACKSLLFHVDFMLGED